MAHYVTDTTLTLDTRQIGKPAKRHNYDSSQCPTGGPIATTLAWQLARPAVHRRYLNHEYDPIGCRYCHQHRDNRPGSLSGVFEVLVDWQVFETHRWRKPTLVRGWVNANLTAVLAPRQDILQHLACWEGAEGDKATRLAEECREALRQVDFIAAELAVKLFVATEQAAQSEQAAIHKAAALAGDAMAARLGDATETALAGALAIARSAVPALGG